MDVWRQSSREDRRSEGDLDDVPQAVGDGLFEVVGVRSTLQLALSRIGCGDFV